MSDLPLLILLLLIIAFLLRVDFIFYIAYVLFGVYVGSQWWTRRALRHLTVDRRAPDHAFLGDQVTVTLNLTNISRLPIPWAKVDEAVPPQLHQPNFVRSIVSVGGRESTQISYDLDCNRRGYYLLGPVSISSGDLFGFADVEGQAISQGQSLTVYPYIISLARLSLPSRTPYGTIRSRQRLFEDPARIAGVREYVPGDSMRYIHWKASARADQLLVRQHQPAIALQTMLFLNLDTKDYDHTQSYGASEHAITVAASLATALVNLRQPVGLITNGRDPLSRKEAQTISLAAGETRAHAMKLLELLARIQLSDEVVPFTTLLGHASADLPWGITLVIITPNCSGSMGRALHALARAGFNVVVLIIESTLSFASIRQQARQLGFTAHHVWRERDVHALFGGA